MMELTQQQLRHLAGHSLQRWVFALADRLVSGPAASILECPRCGARP